MRVHQLIVFDDADREAGDFLPLNELLEERLQLLRIPLAGRRRLRRAARRRARDDQRDEECKQLAHNR